MSRTQRQERERWDATDPARDQPLSPIAAWVLQFLAGAVLEVNDRDHHWDRQDFNWHARRDARARLARQLNEASSMT